MPPATTSTSTDSRKRSQLASWDDDGGSAPAPAPPAAGPTKRIKGGSSSSSSSSSTRPASTSTPRQDTSMVALASMAVSKGRATADREQAAKELELVKKAERSEAPSLQSTVATASLSSSATSSSFSKSCLSSSSASSSDEGQGTSPPAPPEGKPAQFEEDANQEAQSSQVQPSRTSQPAQPGPVRRKQRPRNKAAYLASLTPEESRRTLQLSTDTEYTFSSEAVANHFRTSRGLSKIIDGKGDYVVVIVDKIIFVTFSDNAKYQRALSKLGDGIVCFATKFKVLPLAVVEPEQNGSEPTIDQVQDTSPSGVPATRRRQSLTKSPSSKARSTDTSTAAAVSANRSTTNNSGIPTPSDDDGGSAPAPAPAPAPPAAGPTKRIKGGSSSSSSSSSARPASTSTPHQDTSMVALASMAVSKGRATADREQTAKELEQVKKAERSEAASLQSTVTASSSATSSSFSKSCLSSSSASSSDEGQGTSPPSPAPAPPEGRPAQFEGGGEDQPEESVGLPTAKQKAAGPTKRIKGGSSSSSSSNVPLPPPRPTSRGSSRGLRSSNVEVPSEEDANQEAQSSQVQPSRTSQPAQPGPVRRKQRPRNKATYLASLTPEESRRTLQLSSDTEYTFSSEAVANHFRTSRGLSKNIDGEGDYVVVIVDKIIFVTFSDNAKYQIAVSKLGDGIVCFATKFKVLPLAVVEPEQNGSEPTIDQVQDPSPSRVPATSRRQSLTKSPSSKARSTDTRTAAAVSANRPTTNNSGIPTPSDDDGGSAPAPAPPAAGPTKRIKGGSSSSSSSSSARPASTSTPRQDTSMVALASMAVSKGRATADREQTAKELEQVKKAERSEAASLQSTVTASSSAASSSFSKSCLSSSSASSSDEGQGTSPPSPAPAPPEGKPAQFEGGGEDQPEESVGLPTAKQKGAAKPRTGKRKRGKKARKPNPKEEKLQKLGWEKRKIPYGGKTDYLWISPIMKHKFRSFKKANEFNDLIDAEEEGKGDEEDSREERAWPKFKQIIKKGGGEMYNAVLGYVETTERAEISKKKARKAKRATSATAPIGPIKPTYYSSDPDEDGDEDDGKEEPNYHEVDKILQRRHSKRNGRLEYLIRWKGYDSDEDTWEPKTNFRNCPDAMKEAKDIDREEERKATQKKQKERGQSTIKYGDPPFASPGATPPFSCNGNVVTALVMKSEEDTETNNKATFLSLWAGRRLLDLQYDLPKSAEKISKLRPDKRFVHDGVTYELAASKVKETKNEYRNNKNKSRTAVLSYIATSGRDGLETWNLQEELEKIADFASLPAHKAAARLELLQTPAAEAGYAWPNLQSSYFELIEEKGHEGCGFIPANFFEDLLGTSARTKRVDALQVRIFGPRIGIAKGMLFKKRGISKIQIPCSMVKVPPSRTNLNEDWVVVIGHRCSPSRGNEYIGSYLDPDANNPREDEVYRAARKLPEIYENILCGYGVPRRAVSKYAKEADKQYRALKHTHLMGVADPTGRLPSGSVFITGFVEGKEKERQQFGQAHTEVFVTRSPCLVPNDAKLLRTVSSKPSNMTSEEWEFLCSLSFGHIIFSFPENDTDAPLPCVVGDGDLDGDRFFVVWDETILHHLQIQKGRTRAGRVLTNLENKHAAAKREKKNACSSSSSSTCSNQSWLSEAQEGYMLSLSLLEKQHELTGKLFGLCSRRVRDYGLFNRDALHFGLAYKDSLDTRKHGGTVSLPAHLHDELKPRKLQKLLRDGRSDDGVIEEEEFEAGTDDKDDFIFGDIKAQAAALAAAQRREALKLASKREAKVPELKETKVKHAEAIDEINNACMADTTRDEKKKADKMKEGP